MPPTYIDEEKLAQLAHVTICHHANGGFFFWYSAHEGGVRGAGHNGAAYNAGCLLGWMEIKDSRSKISIQREHYVEERRGEGEGVNCVYTPSLFFSFSGFTIGNVLGRNFVVLMYGLVLVLVLVLVA